MAQTLTLNYIHIIFSTKRRQNMIDENIESELNTYIGGICNNLNCQVIKVGSYKNHVHILCNLSKLTSLSKLTERIKSCSSKWVKTKGNAYKNFYWQDGYAAFSISMDNLELVSGYIGNQHKHHKKISFENEYVEILKANNILFDERYIWS